MVESDCQILKEWDLLGPQNTKVVNLQKVFIRYFQNLM